MEKSIDWATCFKRGYVKFLNNVDESLLSSLVQESEDKQKSSDYLPAESFAINSKFTLFYDSIRILLEALAIKNKLKIYNHECFEPFLKQFNKDLTINFRQVRRKRNRINYYGESISKSEFEVLKEKLERLKQFLQSAL